MKILHGRHSRWKVRVQNCEKLVATFNMTENYVLANQILRLATVRWLTFSILNGCSRNWFSLKSKNFVFGFKQETYPLPLFNQNTSQWNVKRRNLSVVYPGLQEKTDQLTYARNPQTWPAKQPAQTNMIELEDIIIIIWLSDTIPNTEQNFVYCAIALIAVISGLTCKRGERVNVALYWPFSLVCVPL